MRILFLSQEYPPFTDGIGAYTTSVAHLLAARGHEVHVLSCVEGQERADLLDGAVHVHRRGQLRLRGLARMLRAPAAAKRVRAGLSCWVELRRLGQPFDVIEAPDYMAEGLFVAAFRSVPLVGHLHTPMRVVAKHGDLPMDWEHRFADFLERFSVRRAQVLTAPSQLLADTLRREGWLVDRRVYQHDGVKVIRYPAELAKWEGMLPASATGPLVLAAGRLERRKGSEVLVDAAALLASKVPGLEVLFVGRSGEDRDGVPYRTWLEDRACQIGAPCRFVEHIPRDALRASYERARVVAVPSTFDNFPVVALEAMASSRPVVCTDATGTAELLANTDAGSVVPVGDAERLAAALLPYLVDPELADEAGRAARRVLAATCAPELVARQREACYELAISRWSARRGPHRRAR